MKTDPEDLPVRGDPSRRNACRAGGGAARGNCGECGIIAQKKA